MVNNKIPAIILIMYVLLFNSYIICLKYFSIIKPIRQAIFYGLVSLLLVEVMYFINKGFKHGTLSTLLCATIFVAIYTFLTMALYNCDIITSLYASLASFNIGVFAGSIIILISFVRNR